MSALAHSPSEAPPAGEPIHADSGVPPVADLAPEGEPSEASRPTSPRPRKGAKGRSAAKARLVSARRPAPDDFERELDRGIQKLAERRYEIKRGTLELALGNLGLLARSVRVTPEARDGKPLGFRLFAIASDGPIAKLGLRNGDVLVSINGLDIATAERVLDAYSKLKAAPHLVLGLLRQGDELTQSYAIR